MDQDDPLQGNDDVINRCRESLARNSTQLSDLATSESNDAARVINKHSNSQGTSQTAVGYRPLFNMSQLNAAAVNNQSLNPATVILIEMCSSSLSGPATENVQPPTDLAESEAAL